MFYENMLNVSYVKIYILSLFTSLTRFRFQKFPYKILYMIFFVLFVLHA